VRFFVKLNNQKELLIGWCGEFHPKVTRNYEVESTCFGFELNVANIIYAARNLNTFKRTNIATQKFPTVNRDFAFLVDEQVSALEIKNAIQNALSDIIKTEVPVTLTDVLIFDIYRGKSVAKDKR
jgi:phenylalanyl-tRNA synthetase beta chain